MCAAVGDWFKTIWHTTRHKLDAEEGIAVRIITSCLPADQSWISPVKGTITAWGGMAAGFQIPSWHLLGLRSCSPMAALREDYSFHLFLPSPFPDDLPSYFPEKTEATRRAQPHTSSYAPASICASMSCLVSCCHGYVSVLWSQVSPSSRSHVFSPFSLLHHQFFLPTFSFPQHANMLSDL